MGYSRDQLRAALIGWLITDEKPYERTYIRHVPAKPTESSSDESAAGLPEFSKRLGILMDGARLSNRKLGLGSGLDPSYISRVQASPERVVITRTEEPLLSFTFTHPMICRAFVSCLKS